MAEAEAAYQKALRGFEENLNSKQMKEIQRPTSLDQLCQMAGDISKTHEKGQDRKTVRIYQKLNDVRDKLAPFDILLEGLCEASPVGGKFIWGAVRFTFQLVEDNHASFMAVLGFFTDIGQQLSIVQTELQSFKDSTLVTSAGEKIFAVLLEFWTQAIKTYRTMRFGLLNPTRIPLKLKFERLQKELDSQISLMKDAAHAQHHQNFEVFSSTIHDSRRDDLDERIFTWIAAPNYTLDINKASKKRHDGTCEWIFNKPGYQRYLSPDDSINFLVVYGIPGAGKTILSSFLVKHSLELTTPSKIADNDTDANINTDTVPSLVIFHFFKADDGSKNTPTGALRSLLHQIYESLVDANLEEVRSLFQSASRKRNVDYDDLWSLFTSLVHSGLFRLTVVLDALDECGGMKTFAKDILSLMELDNLKIIATGRKTGDHVNILRNASHVEIIQMTQEDVKRDIASFVRYKVGKMYNLRSPNLKRLRTLVIDELSKKDNHKGMFLWAYLMCKEIGTQVKVGQIQRLLRELPTDMGSVYIKILNRLNDKPAANQTFIQHVLRWVVGSVRPLKWTELDQALQIDKFRDEYFEDDDEYGEMDIYSRRDVVKVCGSLVQYTGLDDGDVIGLIHLSTREFLKSSPGQIKGFPQALEKYLVNDIDASLVIGLRCLDVLSTRSIYSSKYFRQLYRRQTSLKDPIAEENPLFEYAVMYWPEYVDALQAGDGKPIEGENSQDLSDLVTLFTQFVQGPFYTSWLEEYIRLGGVDLSSYTARRLWKLELPNLSSKVNKQAMETAHTLQNFSETLERFPGALHFCIPTATKKKGAHKSQTIQVLSSSTDEAETYQPLPKGRRNWMAYDHKSRSLFMADTASEFMRVIRRRTDGDIAFRPALARDKGPKKLWSPRSAILKQDATYLAVTFSPILEGVSVESCYKTVCWSVSNSRDANGAAPWAQIVIIDETAPSIFRVGVLISRGALVIFGENNTLICPGGIWDLATEEKLPSPESVWSPENPENVFQTCFSTNRAVRIRDQRILEVFELFSGPGHEAGQLVGSYEFPAYLIEGEPPDVYGLRIRKVTPLGDKIVITYLERLLPEEPEPEPEPESESELQSDDNDSQNTDAFTRLPFKVRTVCFFIDSDGTGHSIDLYVGSGSVSTYDIQDCEFTPDTESIVGRLGGEEGDVNQGGTTIRLWSLIKDGDGYEPAADTVDLWKTLDSCVTFALTPPLSTEKKGGILIGLSDGGLVKRSLTQYWTDEDDIELGKSQHADDVGARTLTRVDLKGETVYMVSVPRSMGSSPKLLIEAWLIKNKDKPALKFPVIRDDLPANKDINALSMSPDGRFVAAKEKLFHISDTGALSPLPFTIEPGINSGAQFDGRNHRFADVQQEDRNVTIHIYEIEANETVQLLASHEVEPPMEGLNPHEMKVSFAQTQGLSFAYSFWTEIAMNKTCICIVKDGRITTVDVSEDYMPNLSFSECGKYIYNIDNAMSGKPQWPAIYPVDAALYPSPEDLETKSDHPVVIERDLCYIHAPFMYRIWHKDQNGAIYLDRKHIDTLTSTPSDDQYEQEQEDEQDNDPEYESRYIGVIPDLNLNRSENKLFAVWPESPTEEVKLLVRPGGRSGYPTLIKTGILSQDLTGDEGWLDSAVLG